MELIDKADVVAEIKRIMDAENESINSFEHQDKLAERYVLWGLPVRSTNGG